MYTQSLSPYSRIQYRESQVSVTEAVGRAQAIRSAQAITFGSCSSSGSSRGNEKAVLETYIPKPVKPFQWFMFSLNRLFILNPWLSWLGFRTNEFKFADDASKKVLTQKIPKNAGVILVGAHPDRKDGHILAEIHRQAGQYPASTLISSEMIRKFGNYIHPCVINLIKPIFSMLGLIPLNRGERNPEVKNYTIQSIAKGKWNSMFPEGDVRIGPRVFTMQKGAVDMAIQAAIQSNFQRPILLVPFAHSWTYKYPEKAEKELFKCLKTLELETKKGSLDSNPSGTVSERIFRVGHQILDLKLQNYGLHYGIQKPADWNLKGFFQKAEYLQQETTALLEKKYNLPTDSSRLAHNRLMKIRSEAWKVLNKSSNTERFRNRKSFDDLKCTQELLYLSAFSQDDLKQYGNGKALDPEMLACYVLRFGSLMGLKQESFGDRVATVKVMDPIDIREKARVYQQLNTPQAKDEYAIQLTQELLQAPIQEEVNRIRKQAVRWKSFINQNAGSLSSVKTR